MSKHRATPSFSFPQTSLARRFVPLLGALSLLATSGCVTRTLENNGLMAIPAPSDSTASGVMLVPPEARAAGWRILRFDNGGTVAEHSELRQDADRAMAAACAGDFRVTAEGPTAVNGMVTPRLAGTALEQSPFWYVQFVCVRDQDSPGTRG